MEQSIPGEVVAPAQLVQAALDTKCQSMSYTVTEPTIFYELAYDTAVIARERGLKNGFVTNGFINEEPLRRISGVLDAANMHMKFFKEESYRRTSRARLQPVLDAIRLYHASGVWVEVTTLVIPGLNDLDEGLKAIAEFIRDISPSVPWHVTQYYPAYHMDGPHTLLATLRRAREIGLSAGLRYVYEGNVPGEGGENTWCYQCGAPQSAPELTGVNPLADWKSILAI